MRISKLKPHTNNFVREKKWPYKRKEKKKSVCIEQTSLPFYFFFVYNYKLILHLFSAV